MAELVVVGLIVIVTLLTSIIVDLARITLGDIVVVVVLGLFLADCLRTPRGQRRLSRQRRH